MPHEHHPIHRPRAMRLRQLRTPSFRARLRLFFVVIVIVPMITMAVVLFQLIVASERSQTDARLSESQTVSMGCSRRSSRGPAAVASGHRYRPAARRRARRRRRERPCSGGSTRSPGDADARVRRAAARRRRDVRGGLAAGRRRRPCGGCRRPDSNPTGRITVAMLSPEQYAERISSLTAAEVVDRGRRPALATTQTDADPASCPIAGAVDGRRRRLSASPRSRRSPSAARSRSTC